MLQKPEIDVDEHTIQPMGFGRLDLLFEAELLEFEEFADRAILSEELLDAQLLLGGPAQCFISDHLPRPGVHDGLKDHVDYAIVQLELLFPDMDLVAPLLRDVQGSVREADELLGVLPVFGERGDSDAQIERELPLLPQRHDSLSYPLTRIDDTLPIVHEENHHELVSSPPEDEVHVPGRVLNGLPRSCQDLVTHLVAARIVDVLEVVQITKKEREATFLATRSGNFLFDAFVEISSVVQVGERISYREIPEGLLRELAFRDVSEKRNPPHSIPGFISER